ncbi:MAG: response regulator [Victivallales bacterium]
MGKEAKNIKNGNAAPKPLRLLIVEDSQNDADLLIRELKRGGFDPKWKRVETAHDMENTLDTESWDLIISDYKMPNFNGIDALNLLQKKNLDIPFIISSGTIGEEMAVSIMKAGASDYLMKDNLSRLSTAVARELQEAEERSTRKKIESKLRESETLFRTLTKMTPIGIYLTDPKGGCIYANEKWLEMAGMEIEEVIGSGWIKAIHPDDRDNVISSWNKMVESNGKWNLEYRFRTPSGKITIILGLATELRDEKGNITGYVGTNIDITERKKNEESLKLREQEYRTLADNLPDVVARFDRQFRHIYINRQIKSVTSLDSSDYIGRTNRDLGMDETLVSLWEQAIQRVFETGKIERIEFDMPSPEGVISFESRLLPEFGPDGSVNTVLSLARNITELKRLEERLRQSEKMEAIGQLAGGIAHDFNNQLAGIMGYAEMLVARLDDKNLREYAENIFRASRRAADLTRNMLAFSRKGKYLTVPVNVHKVIEEVISILTHSIDKRIEIKRKLSASPAIIMGDPTQLQNALLNLAINARDAITDSGEIVFITENIRMEEVFDKADLKNAIRGPYMKICVSDSGTGMDNETIKHIFEPFYTTKDVGKGTGMGLASVYGTVKSHNGIIKVESELGKGSVFSIYFPVFEDAVESKELKTESEKIIRKARILLVEDEKIVNDMVASMLRSFGHKVIVCDDGIEAIGIYRKSFKTIDIVILDMVMPKMNGKQVFTSLKDINPDIKVILSSGYSIDGDAQSIIDSGAKAFIQKPFNMKELSNLIENVLNGSGK